MFFRKLNSVEEGLFRKWARDNWQPHKECLPIYHPILREEWSKLDNEHLTVEDGELSLSTILVTKQED